MVEAKKQKEKKAKAKVQKVLLEFGNRHVDSNFKEGKRTESKLGRKKKHLS